MIIIRRVRYDEHYARQLLHVLGQIRDRIADKPVKAGNEEVIEYIATIPDLSTSEQTNGHS